MSKKVTEDLKNHLRVISAPDNMKEIIQNEQHFKKQLKENKIQFIITQVLVIITLLFEMHNTFFK